MKKRGAPRKKPNEEKKRRSLIPSMEAQLIEEMEADRKVKDLADILGERVAEEEKREQEERDKDPEAILEDPRFMTERPTLADRFAAWDGKNGLISLIGTVLSLLFLAGCFLMSLLTRGQNPDGLWSWGVLGSLAAVYGLVFGVLSLRASEKRRMLGMIGIGGGAVCLAAFLLVGALGAL